MPIKQASQLLCTFATLDTLDETIAKIVSAYTILFDSLYVLDNVDVPNACCITYNIDPTVKTHAAPPATISLHRKKAVNCLYSINALNLLVAELNGGKPDKNFELPWQDYKNSILVTAYNKLKRINTKLNKIVKVSTLSK